MNAPNGNGSNSKAAAVHSSSQPRWKQLWTRYDLGNFALLVSLIVIASACEKIAPHHRFIINSLDPTINYPLVSQTVPMYLLVLLAGVLPVCALLAVYISQRKAAHAKRELYCALFGWAYAMVLTAIITGFIKRVSGRPRPNFVQYSGYQPDGTFTGSSHDVSDAFQSFPSGHTSTAFCGLGYLSLYLFSLAFTGSFKTREMAQSYHVNQGWKTVLCLLPIGLAIWIGLTRIVDYFHNFDDVSIGAFLGMAVCYLTFQLHCAWHFRTLDRAASVAPISQEDDSEDSTNAAKLKSSMRCDIGPISSQHYTALSSPSASPNPMSLASPTPETTLIDEVV